jgi:mycothiol synthase
MTTNSVPRWLTLDGAPSIAGLRFRRPRLGVDGEYDDLVAVINASNSVEDIPWRITAELLRDDLEVIGRMDPSTDVIVAEADGVPVALAGVERVVRDAVPVYETWGHVTPRWRRHGLGRALLRANLRRAAEAAGADPADPLPRVRASADEREVAHHAMLEAEGFSVIRWFFLMRRDLGDAIPDGPLPAGLDIRPVEHEHHRIVFDAQTEAFRDHWAHREPTEGDFEAMYGRSELDTSLWVVAWDGEAVAGVVENWIWPHENDELGVARGWLERISVRRPWRRRGVARALVTDSLRRLRDAGMTEGMLGVDADNPTGALGLYEGLGFTVERREMTYDRVALI